MFKINQNTRSELPKSSNSKSNFRKYMILCPKSHMSMMHLMKINLDYKCIQLYGSSIIEVSMNRFY